jgi:hypothetical protein
MIADMEHPNWVYRTEQGKWRAHPEGYPDRDIQAASFDELQRKVQELSGNPVTSARKTPLIEPPSAGMTHTDAPRYVLSQDQGKWRGHLQGFPHYSAQGESFDEVEFKLRQLCRDLISGKLSNLRKIA